MKFEEIFNEEGLYTSGDFVKGFCFEIKDDFLIGVQFRSPNDLLPERTKWGVYKGLFKKEYRKVLNINSLFTKQG